MPTKANTGTLLAALKASLKAENISYKGLAQRINMSESSIKRLFAEETFTLKRIEQICDVLGIDLFELARRARGAAAGIDEMSAEQEAALAADPRLLGLFYHLFNDWSVEDILATYELTRPECTLLLARLEKIGLIEVGVNDSVKLKVPKSLRLKRDGPIRRAHGKAVVGDFLQADFVALGAFFRFEFRDLSKASVALIERKLERIAQEFHELAELDSYLPPGERETVGMALGVRPWQMQWVTGIKRRAAT
jgi:DNA-binding Xre family transcriptional regulator